MSQDETSAEWVSFQSWEEAVAVGIELHRSGKMAEAEALYRQILEQQPEQPDALHFLGVACHQRGKGDEAISLIRRAVAASPGYADAHNNLGNVLKEAGRFEEAVDAYRGALEVRPEFADTHNNLGVVLRCLGRIDEAEAAYREAIAIDPKHADAYQNLGNVLKQRGQLREAEAHYRMAIVLDPHHPAARSLLGTALSAAGRFEEAVEVFQEWVDLEPDNPVAVHMLAAASGRQVPPRASDRYVEAVFDNLCGDFDERLSGLQYRAPDLVAQAVERELGAPGGDLHVFDAGCGTGLCAPHLRPYARHLVGVDLSAGMLRRAARLDLYDELIKAELTGQLQAMPAAWDLVVSADTLCYFGDLEAVLGAAARALRPSGVLVFTVELVEESAVPEGFVLNPHGRYSHSARYVEETSRDQGLAVGPVKRDTLRFEADKPVAGLVVVARRETSGSRE